jgi:ABC-type phosphate transport system substrate-binding protein
MFKRTAIVGLFVLLGASVARGGDKGDDLAIVVNKNSTLDNVTQAELVKILREEKSKSADGVRFVVLAREPGSAERSAALKSIFQMTEAEYQKYFLQATFVGAVQAAPKVVSGAAATRQFVAGNPGAVGYLRGSDVDDSVKVVKVDGKSPGDAGYSLKMR